MAVENRGIFGENQNTLTIREQILSYFRKWPLFLICVFLSVATGLFYIRNTEPKYISVTSLLVKGTESGKLNSDDLIESAISGKRDLNLNNEMLLISASNLMERIVEKHAFNFTYFIKGRILNTEIYKDAPFVLIAKQVNDSDKVFNIRIRNVNLQGGDLFYGPENDEKFYAFQWNKPFALDEQYFVLAPKRRIGNEHWDYIARWESVRSAAVKFSENLVVKSYDSKTSVIQLTLKTENLQKGKDVLNALYAELNLTDIEERNNLSKKTVQFIDDRLLAISGELKGVEGNLEDYQGRNQLIDIKGQSTQSLENANSASKAIKDIAIQQGIASMILNYFSTSSKDNKLVPSSLGLNDQTLASLITQYNELQLKKEREAPLVAPNSTVMQDLNIQILNLKSSILESLNNIIKNLNLQESSFRIQNNQYQNFLSSLPHNERILQEIKRKQNITEGLYLYLLQKREEAAISSTASNVVHYKQIDGSTGYGPVEPNVKYILLYTFLTGLFVAFGCIYLYNLLNDKIVSKDDLVRRADIPLLGQISQIPRIPRKKINGIPVLGLGLIGEEFRDIRTKLSLLLKNKDDKTLLVTSSKSEEGKSFISLNLAAVCAIPGKKVALLEFDTRNPLITRNLNLDNKLGLTNYLNGDVTCTLKIRHSLPGIPTLHVFPCGKVPVNPADLLISKNMSRLFEDLKAEFELIIIDSPPAGLVSDSFILGQYSDLVLYVVRHQKTLKKDLDFVTGIVKDQTFKNVTFILNGIKADRKYKYYEN